MTVKIGINYFAMLAEIKNYWANCQRNGFQEFTAHYRTNRGRCCYDRCEHKITKADIVIMNELERKEKPYGVVIRHFHSSCLDNLLTDSRIQSLN